GGPMQFNVTNGPPSTWQLVNDSYIYGRRPAAYGHMTATHPSIYDDFDSIMAAAHLLSADGAEYRLDGSAWMVAYDYYGHDLAGDPVGGAGGAAEQAARELRAAEVQGRVVLPGGADAAVHGDHRARCQIERAAGHRAGGAGSERELVRRPAARPAGVVQQ